MKLTTLLTSAFFALTALADYNVSSKPFHLRTLSHDSKYDGTYLFACHEGAALEGLCVGSKNVTDGDEFNFNTSALDTGFNRTLGKTGFLAWTLVGGNFEVSSGMGLYYDPVTNLALPLFSPGLDDATLVAFRPTDEKLHIQGYIDDTVVPAQTGPTQAYFRWYVCETYYIGYTYTTLTWLMGNGEPQNPSCCKVDVERVFVDGDDGGN